MFPLLSAPRWSNRGKQLYQVNLYRSLTCILIFIVLAHQEAPNSQKHCPPNSPKESGSSPVTSITYLRHLLILPNKLHPDPSTLSVFQDFWFPLQIPPMSPNLVEIWTCAYSSHQVSSWSFHSKPFPRFPIPFTPPNDTGRGRDLR